MWFYTFIILYVIGNFPSRWDVVNHDTEEFICKGYSHTNAQWKATRLYRKQGINTSIRKPPRR